MKPNFSISRRLFYAPNLFLFDNVISALVKRVGYTGGFTAIFSQDSFDNGEFFKKVCSFSGDNNLKLNRVVNFSRFLNLKKTRNSAYKNPYLSLSQGSIIDLGIPKLLTQLPKDVSEYFSRKDIEKFENSVVPFWDSIYMRSNEVSAISLLIDKYNSRIFNSSDARVIPVIISICNGIIPEVQEFEREHCADNKLPYSFSELLFDYNLGEVFIESLIEVIDYIDGNHAPVQIVIDSLIRNLNVLYRNHVETFYKVEDYKCVRFDIRTVNYFISTLTSSLLTDETYFFITAISIKENYKTGFTFSNSTSPYTKPSYTLCIRSVMNFSGVSANAFRKKPSVIQSNLDDYQFSTLSGIERLKPSKDYHIEGNFNIKDYEVMHIKRPKYYSTVHLRDVLRRVDQHFILVCDALNRIHPSVKPNAEFEYMRNDGEYFSRVNSSILFLVNAGIGLPGSPIENLNLMNTFCSSDCKLQMFDTYRYRHASGKFGVTYGKQNFFTHGDYERNVIVARKCTYTFYKVFREFADIFYLNDNPVYSGLRFDYESNCVFNEGFRSLRYVK
ncbi:hypothetical protein AB834_03520 [PVC group bacterium (ex Bugula neritina AB1)]|nr:hypothetical protein AB834_03520 [PVC group bacterium (ex Bugula neritina AB1)]